MIFSVLLFLGRQPTECLLRNDPLSVRNFKGMGGYAVVSASGF